MRHSTVDLIASIHRNGIVGDEVIGQRLQSLLVVIHVAQDRHKNWDWSVPTYSDTPARCDPTTKIVSLPWMAAKRGLGINTWQKEDTVVGV